MQLKNVLNQVLECRGEEKRLEWLALFIFYAFPTFAFSKDNQTLLIATAC